MNRYKPPINAWSPPELTDHELYAFKALSVGKASQGQQQAALACIITKFAATYDMSFRPGGLEGDRATIFAEGKRFVGARILEAISRPMKTQQTQKDESNDGRTEQSTNELAAASRRNPKPPRRDKPAKSGAD